MTAKTTAASFGSWKATKPQSGQYGLVLFSRPLPGQLVAASLAEPYVSGHASTIGLSGLAPCYRPVGNLSSDLPPALSCGGRGRENGFFVPLGHLWPAARVARHIVGA